MLPRPPGSSVKSAKFLNRTVKIEACLFTNYTTALKRLFYTSKLCYDAEYFALTLPHPL